MSVYLQNPASSFLSGCAKSRSLPEAHRHRDGQRRSSPSHQYRRVETNSGGSGYAIVGLSGWLPGSRSLRNKVEGSNEAARRAAYLPILLCHGNSDDVPYKFGEKSKQFLGFKTFDGLGHYTVPKEMDEVCHWLNGRLGLDGSRS